MLGFHLLLKRTTLGIAMRATADNPQLSDARGIFTERIIRLVWFMGAGFAAPGGVMVGLAHQIQRNMGLPIIVLVFPDGILGGIGHPYGAVVGTLVIGVAQQGRLSSHRAPL